MALASGLEDRLRRLVRRASYEQLLNEPEAGEVDEGLAYEAEEPGLPFSWLEYSVFLWLGVSMLWAWNMFLAAAPYFQLRFASNTWALTNFQSCILSISCFTNLASILILAKLQKSASYPRRINSSLVLNIIIFSLLALSAIAFRNVPVPVYFAFLMAMVFGASLATGFNQNGVFAYVAGFGRSEYTQAVMAGQGVAGVLPCIVQIASVLAVPEKSEKVTDESIQNTSAKSAFAFFVTAVAVSATAFFAFLFLMRQKQILLRTPLSIEPEESEATPTRKPVPLWTLFKKLRWMALAVYLCFAITMAYPVFTAQIQSVHPKDSLPRLLQSSIFIPLALLFWNTGDLVGRLILLIPQINMTHRPFMLFLFSIARIIFIPLYMLCNIHGRGAWINSDTFYLVIVQFLFGATNGYIGGSCMMGAAEWVDVDEREAAGGFMGFMLVAGLSTGSLLSFFVAG
ncbi:hypothetical protein FQN50_000660 [Emmonsiellopsis sp. PD_5]|nr:hypothetical protein FQN50_000660 [Emmonsiellopsis sp. PD_5]